MIRTHLLEQLAERIVSLDFPHPVRVAIDGIDAAGKTTLANDLAPLIEVCSRRVIRASIDGFHRPRAERYRRGPDSPEGYYEDSFDYPALCAVLLQPLGLGGDRCYRAAVFDYHRDRPLSLSRAEPPFDIAPGNVVLLFDGIFLLRPEINSYWDFRLFIDISFETCLQRAIQRDLALFGSPEAVRRRYRQRYLPAQEHYLQTVNPHAFADIVIDNNDPANPMWITGKAY